MFSIFIIEISRSLFGVKNFREAKTLMIEVVRAVKDYDNDIKVIACGYADFNFVGCINPLELPSVANKSDADGVLVDVKIKNGKNRLFDYLSDNKLAQFVSSAHEYNLITALAGSLDVQDISRVYRLKVDIIGVRGAVCYKKDRISGTLQQEKVTEFIETIHKIKNS